MQPKLSQKYQTSDQTIEAQLQQPIGPGVAEIIVPGQDYVPFMGKVLDARMDGWLAACRLGGRFEQKLAKRFNCEYSLLIESGSTDLIALCMLTSPKLKKRAVKSVAFCDMVNPAIHFSTHLYYLQYYLPTW